MIDVTSMKWNAETYEHIHLRLILPFNYFVNIWYGENTENLLWFISFPSLFQLFSNLISKEKLQDIVAYRLYYLFNSFSWNFPRNSLHKICLTCKKAYFFWYIFLSVWTTRRQHKQIVQYKTEKIFSMGIFHNYDIISYLEKQI